MIKLQGGGFSCLHYESDFLLQCLRGQLLTIFPSGSRNGGIINSLDFSVQKRWPLQQQSGFSLHPCAHGEAGIQSSYLKVKSVGAHLSGGSAGAKGKGCGGRACQQKDVIVSPLQLPFWCTWGPWWPTPRLQKHHGGAPMGEPETGRCFPPAKSPTLQSKPCCAGFAGGEAFWAYTSQGGSWSPLCGSQRETRGLDFQKVGGLALAENKTHLSCHHSRHLERFRPRCLVSWPFP